jgi:hypothetical protein
MRSKAINRASGVSAVALFVIILTSGSLGVHDMEFYLVTLPCGLLLVIALGLFLVTSTQE